MTSDDSGLVKLFNYPCVVEDAPHRAYRGHSAHVMCVRFSCNDRRVISAGAPPLRYGFDTGCFLPSAALGQMYGPVAEILTTAASFKGELARSCTWITYG